MEIYPTNRSEQSFSEQDRNVLGAIRKVFIDSDRLPATVAWHHFEGMDPAGLERHARVVGAAVLAAARGNLTPEVLERLTNRHQELGITEEEFDVTAAVVLGALGDAGERDVAAAIADIAPQLREAFVTPWGAQGSV